MRRVCEYAPFSGQKRPSRSSGATGDREDQTLHFQGQVISDVLLSKKALRRFVLLRSGDVLHLGVLELDAVEIVRRLRKSQECGYR